MLLNSKIFFSLQLHRWNNEKKKNFFWNKQIFWFNLKNQLTSGELTFFFHPPHLVLLVLHKEPYCFPFLLVFQEEADRVYSRVKILSSRNCSPITFYRKKKRRKTKPGEKNIHIYIICIVFSLAPTEKLRRCFISFNCHTFSVGN